MKNAFYFILKALFAFKIFKFLVIFKKCLNFWPCRKNGSTGKIRLISKFMTSQPGKQTIAIHARGRQTSSRLLFTFLKSYV